MTLKKQKIRLAKRLRKSFGLDFVTSLAMAKGIFKGDVRFPWDFKKFGLIAVFKDTGTCPSDGDPIGLVIITNPDKGITTTINFDCCGICWSDL